MSAVRKGLRWQSEERGKSYENKGLITETMHGSMCYGSGSVVDPSSYLGALEFKN